MKSQFFIVIVISLLCTNHLKAQCNYNNAVMYLVTTDSDFVAGSLRDAINQANIDNTGGIIVPVSADTLYLQAPLPDITTDYLGIFPNVTVIIDAGFTFTDPGPQITASNSCWGAYVKFINVAPAYYSVTTTSDAGSGSLREAISKSNFSESGDIISFNIPGMAPHTISPLTELPLIDMPLTIDGTTQPANGYAGTAPKIILDGTNKTFTGLHFDYYYFNHLYDAAAYGLHIRNFDYGINSRHSRNFTCGSATKRNVISANNYGANFTYDSTLTFENNYVGTSADGDSADGNLHFGISLVGDSVGYRYFLNNVISGNESGLVIYTNAGGNVPISDIQIKGNLVGTDKTGSYAIPNLNYGIEAGDNYALIGGINPGDANLFSGNCINSPVIGKAALAIGKYCKVIGNKFGTNLAGTDTIRNAYGTSVYIFGDAQVGGSSNAEGNLIAASSRGIYTLGGSSLIQNNIIGTDAGGTLNWGNTYAGIDLFSDNNIILSNVIKNNQIGIDISGGSNHDSILNNDISNNSLNAIRNNGNYNVFSQNSIANNNFGIVNQAGGNSNIAAPQFFYTTADSVAGSALPGAKVELFHSESLNNTAQGKDYIVTVTADTSGNWEYHTIVPLPNPLKITATQTDSSGNTSEFTILWQQAAPDVWPGDCNYDLTVDNFDFLYLNLALNDTGPARAGASINWFAQPAGNWQNNYASGINHKHADCDGNGIVELIDSNAILFNFGQVHLFKNPLPSNTNALDVYVTSNKDTVAPGDTVTFTLYVGNTVPVDSLFGISWNYYFDPLYTDTNYISADYSNSALGVLHSNMESLQKNYFPQGYVDVALCRTDKTDTTSVNGVLATLSLKTKASISSVSTLTFSTWLIRGLTASETFLNFIANDVKVVIDPVLLTVQDNAQQGCFVYYANQSYIVTHLADGYPSCILEIYSITGALMQTTLVKPETEKTDVQELPQGVYLYRLITPYKTFNGKFYKNEK